MNFSVDDEKEGRRRSLVKVQGPAAAVGKLLISGESVGKS
jgi:hypothetical protein